MLALNTQIFSKRCTWLASSDSEVPFGERAFIGRRMDLEHPERAIVARSMALTHCARLGGGDSWLIWFFCWTRTCHLNSEIDDASWSFCTPRFVLQEVQCRVTVALVPLPAYWYPRRQKSRFAVISGLYVDRVESWLIVMAEFRTT